MKKTAGLSLALAALFALSLCGCAGTAETADASSQTAQTQTAQTTATTSASEMFTDRDLEIGYDEETSAHITLSGDSASSDSDAVQISGSTVTITDEGTYILSGTLEDGMILVDAEDTDKVQLVLNGVEITSATSAAIYVREADKVFITTAAGSENTLRNGGEYVAIDDNNIDAVIFSKSDLTLNGAGTLTITAAAGHGIVSKDDLVLASGTYVITAASHGISGKDSVRIANGAYTIVSGKDGIHAENADDASLGFLYIVGGTHHHGGGRRRERRRLPADRQRRVYHHHRRGQRQRHPDRQHHDRRPAGRLPDGDHRRDHGGRFHQPEGDQGGRHGHHRGRYLYP